MVDEKSPALSEGERKLAFVREQCQKMWLEGKETEMSCPYCLSIVPVGESPCCPTLARAVYEIIYAQQMIEAVDQANRIRDRIERN